MPSSIAAIANGSGAPNPPIAIAAWFLGEVVPKLDAFSLSPIAKATGLSLAACSRIRAGTSVPHARNWPAFATLAGACTPQVRGLLAR